MGRYNDKLKLSHCKICTDQTQIFHHVCEIKQSVEVYIVMSTNLAEEFVFKVDSTLETIYLYLKTAYSAIYKFD